MASCILEHFWKQILKDNLCGIVETIIVFTYMYTDTLLSSLFYFHPLNNIV